MTSTAGTSSGSGSPGTIGALLGRCLVTLGARRAFASVANVGPVGSTGPVRTDLGLDLHAVGDPALAALLAAADGRIGTGPGVAVLDGQRVLLTSAPGVAAEVITVDDPAHLPGALAGWTLGLVHAAVEYVLDLDLDAPAPAGLEPMVLDDTSGDLLSLSPTLADFRLLILAGPGVVRSGHVAGLQALAAQTGAGVANTWGAKGVFPWDDPHHFGTVGMQARDFELAGFDEAELVIATGLDLLESPTERWSGSAQVLEVEPWQLSSLALRWPEPEAVPEPPPSTACCPVPWPTATRARTSRSRRPGPRRTCRPRSRSAESSPPTPAPPASGSLVRSPRSSPDRWPCRQPASPGSPPRPRWSRPSTTDRPSPSRPIRSTRRRRP